MDFKTATDRLTAAVTAAAIAAAFGVARETIARARLDRKLRSHRPPPENWQPILARLAREREEHFRQLAEELERKEP